MGVSTNLSCELDLLILRPFFVLFSFKLVCMVKSMHIWKEGDSCGIYQVQWGAHFSAAMQLTRVHSSISLIPSKSLTGRHVKGITFSQVIC